MNDFTQALVPFAYTFGMAGSDQPPPYDDQGDLSADYALIAAGIGAALLALAYLLLS